MRILAILGSLGSGSKNAALLQHAIALAPNGIHVTIYAAIGDLPYFDPDIDAERAPASVQALRRAVAESDALMIACPEYGFSLPGVLKNAIDWLIGTGELERKRVAITASVPDPQRGLRGLAALRQTLSAVSADVVHDGPIVRGETEADALRTVLAALRGA